MVTAVSYPRRLLVNLANHIANALSRANNIHVCSTFLAKFALISAIGGLQVVAVNFNVFAAQSTTNKVKAECRRRRRGRMLFI